MSSDLLRRAAKTLREHAQSLPSTMTGRWFTRSGSVIADDGTDVGMLVLEPYTPSEDAPLMAFVALMHPPVALALADWLEAMTEDVERAPVPDDECPCPWVDGYHKAVDLARAILREGDTDATP